MSLPINPTTETSKDGFSEIFTLGEIQDNGKVKVRLLAGPFIRKLVWYPTIARSNDTGLMEFSGRTFITDPNSVTHFFSPLAKAEKLLLKEAGRDNDSPKLNPHKTFLYVGIVRGQEKLQYSVIELKYTTQDALEKLEKAESQSQPGKLKWGPYFLYDLIIRKEVDPKKSKKAGTTYHLSIADEEFLFTNGIANQIPIGTSRPEVQAKYRELIDKSFYPVDNEFSKTADGGNEAFLAKVAEAEKVRTPNTDAEILQLLEQFPLNLFAVQDNKFVFCNPHKLFTQIQERSNIKLLEEGTIKQLQAEVTKRNEQPVPSETSESTEMPEWSEVGIDPTPEQAVKPTENLNDWKL